MYPIRISISPIANLQGFSLFELLAVMVILAIAYVVGIPHLKNVWRKEDERSLQKQLINAIDFTQRMARLTHQPMGLCPSQDLQQCASTKARHLLSFVDNYRDGHIHKSQQIILIQQHNMRGELHWRAFPDTRHYMRFTQQGADNGSIWFCRTKERKPTWVLILNKAGRLRIAEKDEITAYACA